MQSITLNSRVNADGNLHLDIPTDLTDTEVEITILLNPISDNKQQSFSKWWEKQTINIPPKKPEQDLKFDYLAERYNL